MRQKEKAKAVEDSGKNSSSPFRSFLPRLLSPRTAIPSFFDSSPQKMSNYTSSELKDLATRVAVFMGVEDDSNRFEQLFAGPVEDLNEGRDLVRPARLREAEA